MGKEPWAEVQRSWLSLVPTLVPLSLFFHLASCRLTVSLILLVHLIG